MTETCLPYRDKSSQVNYTLTNLAEHLRACLVRVRVRMVLYALFYEKDIPN